MDRILLTVVLSITGTACGGSAATGSRPAVESTSGPEPGGGASARGGHETARDNEFQLRESADAEFARGERPSEIEATATHAAMRLIVVDRDDGPIQGTVVKLTAPDGTAYYTDETDSQGYAEVLVPAGQRYEVEYLSLGRRNTMAGVNVPPGPRQDIRLTMRYRRWRPPTTPERDEGAARDVRGIELKGVLFETGRATIQAESYPRLDRVVEYMEHRPRSRIRIAGHTDNVGSAQANQTLSEARARAVRDYLMSHGIDEGRVEAVGYGAEQPVASNDTEEGRSQNRRIEAIEL